MKQHQELMRDILETGTVKGDRTGTGTISKFGGMMKFNIQHGLWPIPTTREVAHEKISQELEWMIKGLISVQWLKDHKNPIWNAWAGEQSGTIGPMYGEQWRNWNAGIGKELSEEDEWQLRGLLEEAAANSGSDLLYHSVAIGAFKEFMAEKSKTYEQGGRSGTDQFQYIIDELKNNPDSRRMCVSVWHASLLPDTSMSPKDNADAGRMALAPCHSMWQVDTKELTDLEILRETVWNMDMDEDQHKNLLDNVTKYSLDIFVAVANGGLISEGYVEQTRKPYKTPMAAIESVLLKHTGVMPDELTDRYLKLTEKGIKRVKEYRANPANPTRKLSLLCFARSQDTPLGTVYNVGEYSLLAHALAYWTNMLPWEYTHMMGDYHIYANQVPMVEEQLTREPLPPARVDVSKLSKDFNEFDHTFLEVDYKFHPKIVFPKAAV